MEASSLRSLVVDPLPRRGTVLGVDPRQLDELMKKAVVTPGFEKVQTLPPRMSRKARRLARRAQKEANRPWFQLPRAEMSAERKRDLQVLAMRGVIDEAAHYRRSGTKALPKNFEVGRVVDNPIDFYSSRIPKRQRKATIVDELLADADTRRSLRQKYTTILARNKHLRKKKQKKKK